MKVGDLVKWRHPSETSIGLITEIKTTIKTDTDISFVCWSDGDMEWYENIDLEVINESR